MLQLRWEASVKKKRINPQPGGDCEHCGLSIRDRIECLLSKSMWLWQSVPRSDS
jgi:hypothetical protein